MTTKEAVERLDEMQSQIIHGKRTFGDIADVILKLELVRLAALKEVAAALDLEERPSESLLLAHRILANNNPKGLFTGGTVNSVSEKAKP